MPHPCTLYTHLYRAEQRGGGDIYYYRLNDSSRERTRVVAVLKVTIFKLEKKKSKKVKVKEEKVLKGDLWMMEIDEDMSAA